MDRREIVATKAMCQVFGHAAKLLYFGGIIEQAASLDPLVAALAIARLADRHQAADPRARRHERRPVPAWANRIIMAIAGYYIAHGTYLAVLPAFVP